MKKNGWKLIITSAVFDYDADKLRIEQSINRDKQKSKKKNKWHCDQTDSWNYCSIGVIEKKEMFDN